MIELTEESDSPSFATTELELYAVLGVYYGRVLRIEASNSGSYRGLVSHYSTLLTGRLERIELGLRSDGGKIQSTLKAVLSGSSEFYYLEAENFRIEALQEDSGQWKLIHQGVKWTPIAEELKA